ncbi:protein kinase domain-containing protein [Paractinoplanes ferrugineus]|nr:protein kinase [Actinoplanes ferrugineus]
MLAGRYGLGDALGQDGGAVVHHGFDTVLRRSVAVKLFSPDASDVLREARTAAGLGHPNIAQVYDYGEIGDGGTPYLVMEFLDGETLADRLARTGALRWREAAQICAGVAGALAAAHAQSLVHGGISPRTVKLTTDGVKVLDFEMATAVANYGVDVSALGFLLFECLTGAPARPGEQLPRILGAPRDLSLLYEACATEAVPAASVAEALRRIAGPVPSVRSANPSRSRRRAAAMASAAVVTAVLSILGVQLANGTATPGGRSAEAAVEAPPPATAVPATSSPVRPTPSVSGSVRKPVVTSTARAHKKARVYTPQTSAPPSAAPSASPSKTPPSAPPSTKPTPKPTTDDSTPPVEPTDTPTTPAPEDTPPVNGESISG